MRESKWLSMSTLSELEACCIWMDTRERHLMVVLSNKVYYLVLASFNMRQVRNYVLLYVLQERMNESRRYRCEWFLSK